MSNTDREPTARDRTYQERIDELSELMISASQHSATEPATEAATAAPVGEELAAYLLVLGQPSNKEDIATTTPIAE